jgi:hypothetical protein
MPKNRRARYGEDPDGQGNRFKNHVKNHESRETTLAEAGQNATPSAQAAIASVIRNRMAVGDYGSTPTGSMPQAQLISKPKHSRRVCSSTWRAEFPNAATDLPELASTRPPACC